MKFFITLLFGLFILIQTSLSQCPHPDLKIQSAICDSARHLKIDTVTCSLLKVKWQGKQNQSYHINAGGIDLSTNRTYEIEKSNYSCNSYGNCVATIPVRAGSRVNWSVQSVCTKDNNSLTSYDLNGPEALIPTCVSPISNIYQTLRAYPNPTTGILNVEYSKAITAYTKISVSDMAGKKVFSILGNTVTRTGTGFQLDLHYLLSGNYVLHVSNGKDQSQVKFVLIKD